MIMTANMLQAQQFLPNLRQQGFQFVFRRFITTCCHSRLLRVGQRLTVKFTVRGQRESFQRHKGAGQHIIGQMLRQLLAQFGRHQFNAGLRPEIGHQTFFSGNVFTVDNNRFAYSRALGKACLDLTELNAETAQLDLKIVAAKVLDIAIRQPTAKVTGFVQPGIGCC